MPSLHPGPEEPPRIGWHESVSCYHHSWCNNYRAISFLTSSKLATCMKITASYAIRRAVLLGIILVTITITQQVVGKTTWNHPRLPMPGQFSLLPIWPLPPLIKMTVMLSLDRNEHRPCEIKGSSYVKTQVGIDVFQHNNSDGVASKVQGSKEEVPTQK